MKPAVAFALVLVASPAVAQQTGVAHPPDTIIEDAPPMEALPPAALQGKPSAAVPLNAAPLNAAPSESPANAAPVATTDEVYKPYRPEVTLHQRTEAAVDPDAGIVTEVPRNPNELPVGTALRIRLRSEIDTELTQPNTPFVADLAENVMSDGRVVLPAGASVEGIVTQVRGGRRLRGAALIHLQAQTVVMPDGTRVPFRAAVMDTDQYANTRVDEEGNIKRKDHVGATLAAMSLTTGGAAAAGAVLGGGVGAVVGAGVGAGVSTAWWLKQDRQAHLPKDTLVVLGLTQPLEIRTLSRMPEFSAAPVRGTMQPVAPASAYAAPQAFVPTN